MSVVVVPNDQFGSTLGVLDPIQLAAAKQFQGVCEILRNMGSGGVENWQVIGTTTCNIGRESTYTERSTDGLRVESRHRAQGQFPYSTDIRPTDRIRVAGFGERHITYNVLGTNEGTTQTLLLLATLEKRI